jgi:hypothetical protein
VGLNTRIGKLVFALAGDSSAVGAVLVALAFVAGMVVARATTPADREPGPTIGAAPSQSASPTVIASPARAPSPSPTLSPMPTGPSDLKAIAVEVRSPDGGGPVAVEIMDASGSLTAARPATTAELARATRSIMDSDIGAVNAAGDKRSVILVWAGSVCDLTARLTISADVGALRFEPGPRPACDLARLGRGVVLSYSHAVSADDLKLTARRPTLTGR